MKGKVCTFVSKHSAEKIMNSRRQPARLALLAALMLVTVVSFVIPAAAGDGKVRPAITVANLEGPWQIAVAGNTGCGVSSLLFTGTLNAGGTAVGTLTGSSAGCGSSSSTQTFTIISLNANGTGTAGLTCGSDCGWTFDIQVSANKQVFNLVDVVNGGANVLAGTAIKQ
jgi:hypothetical protein